MWAITPEGRSRNLGEVLLNETASKLNVTTELQAFGLGVTAEPYFAVSQPSDVLMVNVSDVLFDTGRHTLKPGAREKLARVAGILLAYPDLTLEVDGHTDNVGDENNNQDLSERRAESVRAILVQQGIPASSHESTLRRRYRTGPDGSGTCGLTFRFLVLHMEQVTYEAAARLDPARSSGWVAARPESQAPLHVRHEPRAPIPGPRLRTAPNTATRSCGPFRARSPSRTTGDCGTARWWRYRAAR